MAKLVGIVSSAISGKSGGVVFAKGSDGSTIMRPYQPKVKNPNTEAQLGVRSKFKLLSVLSAGMKNAIMLAPNRGETQRNAFIRVNSRNVRVVGTDSQIDARALVISRGTDPLGGVPTFSAQQGHADRYSITIPGATGNTIGYGVAVIVLDPDNGVTDVYSYYFDGSATKFITLPSDNLANCRVYAYRIEATNAGGAAIYSDLTDSSGDVGQNLMINVRRMVASGAAYPTASVCVTPTV